MATVLRFGSWASLMLGGVFAVYAMFCAANLHWERATFALLAMTASVRLSSWCMRQQKNKPPIH